MSIRIRMVDGKLVALCAARSMPKEGDRYLDDGEHYALAQKFAHDYELSFADPDYRDRTEREESNNPNREQWDKDFGAPVWR